MSCWRIHGWKQERGHGLAGTNWCTSSPSPANVPKPVLCTSLGTALLFTCSIATAANSPAEQVHQGFPSCKAIIVKINTRSASPYKVSQAWGTAVGTHLPQPWNRRQHESTRWSIFKVNTKGFYWCRLWCGCHWGRGAACCDISVPATAQLIPTTALLNISNNKLLEGFSLV